MRARFANFATLGARTEGGCNASCAGAASASHAVDKVLRHLGQIVVNDVRDTFDVNTAGGHIGCYQDRYSPC